MEKITCVNCDVLRWARINAGKLKQKKFEGNLERIQRWENGDDFPTYAQLEEIADIYKRPIAVFFFPDPPLIKNFQAGFRTMTEVECSEISYKVVRLINEALVMQMNIKELNEGINSANTILHNFLRDYEDSILIREARNVLGITIEKQVSMGSSKDMFELWRDAFYNHGIYVFKAAFQDENISGFCIYDEEFPIIYINNSMSFTRQIFTLFHELYHLIRETGGIDKIYDNISADLSKEQQEIESMCNSFAGNFLIPTDALLYRIKDEVISYALVMKLAKDFNVSREAIMIKLKHLDKITWDFYHENVEDIRNEFYRTKSEKPGGNHYYKLISYLGKGYLRAAFSAYQANKIDINQLAYYTKTPVSNISTLEATWGWK